MGLAGCAQAGTLDFRYQAVSFGTEHNPSLTSMARPNRSEGNDRIDQNGRTKSTEAALDTAPASPVRHRNPPLWFSPCFHSHEPATFQGGGGHFCGRVPRLATSQGLKQLSRGCRPTCFPRAASNPTADPSLLGLGFRVKGLGFRVYGLWFRV